MKGRASGDSRKDCILELASRGMTDKAIATELGLSVHTVDYYWRRIRADLGVSSRSEAIAVVSAGHTEATPQDSKILGSLRSWPKP